MQFLFASGGVLRLRPPLCPLSLSARMLCYVNAAHQPLFPTQLPPPLLRRPTKSPSQPQRLSPPAKIVDSVERPEKKTKKPASPRRLVARTVPQQRTSKRKEKRELKRKAKPDLKEKRAPLLKPAPQSPELRLELITEALTRAESEHPLRDAEKAVLRYLLEDKSVALFGAVKPELLYQAAARAFPTGLIVVVSAGPSTNAKKEADRLGPTALFVDRATPELEKLLSGKNRARFLCVPSSISKDEKFMKILRGPGKIALFVLNEVHGSRAWGDAVRSDMVEWAHIIEQLRPVTRVPKELLEAKQKERADRVELARLDGYEMSVKQTQIMRNNTPATLLHNTVMRKKVPRALVVSASPATDDVLKDVKHLFQIKYVVKSDTRRDNVVTLFRTVNTQEERQAAVLQVLTQHPGKAMVITATDEEAKRLRDFLTDQPDFGREVIIPSLGLDENSRSRIQDQFSTSERAVLVGTTESVMDYESADIRSVTLCGLPAGMHAYAQYVNKASRDGQPGICVVVTDLHKDLSVLRSQILPLPNRAAIQKIVQIIAAGAKTDLVLPTPIAKELKIPAPAVARLLSFMVKLGYLKEIGHHESLPAFQTRPHLYLRMLIPEYVYLGDSVAETKAKLAKLKPGSDEYELMRLNLKQRKYVKTPAVRLKFKIAAKRWWVASRSERQPVVNQELVCASVSTRMVKYYRPLMASINQFVSFMFAEECQSAVLSKFLGSAENATVAADASSCGKCHYCLNGPLQQSPKLTPPPESGHVPTSQNRLHTDKSLSPMLSVPWLNNRKAAAPSSGEHVVVSSHYNFTDTIYSRFPNLANLKTTLANLREEDYVREVIYANTQRDFFVALKWRNLKNRVERLRALQTFIGLILNRYFGLITDVRPPQLHALGQQVDLAIFRLPKKLFNAADHVRFLQALLQRIWAPHSEEERKLASALFTGLDFGIDLRCTEETFIFPKIDKQLLQDEILEPKLADKQSTTAPSPTPAPTPTPTPTPAPTTQTQQNKTDKKGHEQPTKPAESKKGQEQPTKPEGKVAPAAKPESKVEIVSRPAQLEDYLVGVYRALAEEEILQADVLPPVHAGLVEFYQTSLEQKVKS